MAGRRAGGGHDQRGAGSVFVFPSRCGHSSHGKCVLNVSDARSSLVTVTPYGKSARDSPTCKCDTVQKIKLSLFDKGRGKKTDSALSRTQTGSV